MRRRAHRVPQNSSAPLTSNRAGRRARAGVFSVTVVEVGAARRGGAYAILWLLGLHASLVALPHGMEDEGPRLRYGLLAEGVIPYGEIEASSVAHRKAPNPGDGLSYAPGGDALYLAAGGETDVALCLGRTTSIDFAAVRLLRALA
jgi:hypothetical protein